MSAAETRNLDSKRRLDETEFGCSLSDRVVLCVYYEKNYLPLFQFTQ